MSRKLFKALGLLLLCLFIILGYNADVAADASQPLQVQLDEHGQLSVKLWHWQQPFSPVFDYYHQYRVSDNHAVPAATPEWGTWLTFTDNQQNEPVLYHHAGQALSSQLTGQTRNYLFGEGELVRYETDDYLELSVTWLLAEHDLKLTQTVIHNKSAWHFSINWQIENVGDQVYEDLYLTHGGHSHLYQQTRNRSSWDETRRRLVLWPEDRWASGLMLMGGNQLSPAESYFAGPADALLSLPRHQPLPNLSEPAFTDHSLLIQWHRSRLNPGEQWLISAWQQFTAPVSLAMELPRTIEASPGSSVILEGTLTYYGDKIELPDISSWCLAPVLAASDCQNEKCCKPINCLGVTLDKAAPPVISLGPATMSDEGAGGFSWPVEVSWVVPDELLDCDYLCIDEVNEAYESDDQEGRADNSDSGTSVVTRCESVTIRLTALAEHNLDPYTVFSASTDILVTRQQVPKQPEQPEPEPDPDHEPESPDETDPSGENQPSVPEDPGNTEDADLPDVPQKPDAPEEPLEPDVTDDPQPTEDPQVDPEPEAEKPQQDKSEDQQQEKNPGKEDVQPDEASDQKTSKPDLVQNPKTGDNLYLQLSKTKQRMIQIIAPFLLMNDTIFESLNLRQISSFNASLVQTRAVGTCLWMIWLLIVLTLNLFLHKSMIEKIK